jgi:hypothetical protein
MPSSANEFVQNLLLKEKVTSLKYFNVSSNWREWKSLNKFKLLTFYFYHMRNLFGGEASLHPQRFLMQMPIKLLEASFAATVIYQIDRNL